MAGAEVLVVGGEGRLGAVGVVYFWSAGRNLTNGRQVTTIVTLRTLPTLSATVFSQITRWTAPCSQSGYSYLSFDPIRLTIKWRCKLHLLTLPCSLVKLSFTLPFRCDGLTLSCEIIDSLVTRKLLGTWLLLPVTAGVQFPEMYSNDRPHSVLPSQHGLWVGQMWRLCSHYGTGSVSSVQCIVCTLTVLHSFLQCCGTRTVGTVTFCWKRSRNRNSVRPEPERFLRSRNRNRIV